MKFPRFNLRITSAALALFVGSAGSLLAQSTSASRVREVPGPNPDLFDGTKAEEESRPESGIISDFEMGSGESDPQASQNSKQQQQDQQGSQGQQQGGGSGGSGPQGSEQGQGGGGSEEKIEEGEMPEQQQGQQGQQGEQGQQGGQQGGQQSQSSSSSSSSQKGGQPPPKNNVTLGDDSLKIETVEMPADESLIGQEESKKPAAEDTGAGGASGKQGPRQNTGVEQGDAMPSDI